MIEFPREQQNNIPTSSLKIIGLGGAGANMLDRIALDGIDGAELVAMNTDIRTLAGAVASEKITLGRNLTKGLGAGGDPELGHQAVLEAEKEIRAAIKGRSIVFLCVGLGGGTGSGGAPLITRIAREEGAFVVVFATMPFVFEGRRRREQAETALNELAVLSNALVTFDNNRMGELVLAKQGIHEAFDSGDRMISESIKAVIRLVIRPGLIHVGLDELMSALRTTRSRCLFGSGIASGKDRASRALRGALSSPLLDQGALLKDAQTVLVHLCGGEDLTLYEIELLMQGLWKYVPEKAHILFGAAVDPSMGGDLSITLISALPEDCLASAPRQPTTHISADEPALEPSEGFGKMEFPAATPPPIPTRRSQGTTPSSVPFSPNQETIEFNPKPAKPPMAKDREKPTSKPNQPPAFDIPFAEPEPESIHPLTIDRESSRQASPIPHFSEFPHNHEAGYADTSEPELITPEEPESYRDAPWPAPDYTNPDISWQAEEMIPASPPPTDEAPAPRAKPKFSPAQSELSFDGGPRGRFSGETPNFFEGEDLDIPPFLRKKKS